MGGLNRDASQQAEEKEQYSIVAGSFVHIRPSLWLFVAACPVHLPNEDFPNPKAMRGLSGTEVDRWWCQSCLA